MASEELVTLENDIPELFNCFNESVVTGLDFWASACSPDLVREIAAGGFEGGAGDGEEMER